MSQRNKQSDIYNNWQMLSPDGVLLARTSQKRAKWYLNRDLAIMESEKVIRLKFKPAGTRNIEVPFLLEEKQNHCVVCGTMENLNRHHVVPYQYRKWMEEKDKGHSSYDVLPICLDHHDEYEEVAQNFSRELAIKYNAPFSVGKMDSEDVKTKKMLGLLKVIAEGRPVPQERLTEIKKLVEEFFLKTVDQATAQELIKTTSHLCRVVNGKSHGQAVVEEVLMVNGLQKFIESWRTHFIKTMNPSYLSKNWDIYHVHNE